MRLLQNFHTRNVRCTLFCIGHNLYVRLLLLQPVYYLARPDPPKPDRRRGFSNRATSAMFVATAINFLVSTVVTGIQVTIFIRAIREALIIDMDYPLSEKLELVTKVVWNFDIVVDWAGTISVSTIYPYQIP